MVSFGRRACTNTYAPKLNAIGSSTHPRQTRFQRRRKMAGFRPNGSLPAVTLAVALVLCANGPTWVASASPATKHVEEAQKDLTEWISKLWRELHQYPELAYQEEKTSRLVRTTLDSLGISYTYPLATTGLVATIGRPGGRHVAVRADMDGLAITEATDLPHKSKVEGKMHGCGHDAHTAMVLGAAKLLKAKEAELQGQVSFVFQPAEEAGAGAYRMLEDGLFKNDHVDAIFGLHVDPYMFTGQASVYAGTVLASAGTFKVTLTATGGHGAWPHLTADTVVAGASIVLMLQTLISRRLSAQEAGVVSVTMFQGGSALNVLPSEVVLGGTWRSLSVEGNKNLKEWIRQMILQQATVMGVNATIDFFDDKHPTYPPTVNDPRVANFARGVIEKVLGPENTKEGYPQMGAEDFAFYTERIPACFFLLGVRHEDTVTPGPLHTPRFSLDEAALPIGAAIHANLVLDFLNEGSGEDGKETGAVKEEL
ncbi:peptidase M20/M25/M40 family protein [Klebsormidium nitens]|uniref:Peptidase M20/M25/M40 family protein n=1 Tax=Klebsormidium nitens TaxID=105231 RepID=A0A1Y1ILE8_KLENI|nr:peptidase M20/M25/M40 family protein [Klebsormidium nitens]|eukprot:GAQ88938.1 peptidase M20/M25/M40 family protein [Klebsormidium nitens]